MHISVGNECEEEGEHYSQCEPWERQCTRRTTWTWGLRGLRPGEAWLLSSSSIFSSQFCSLLSFSFSPLLTPLCLLGYQSQYLFFLSSITLSFCFRGTTLVLCHLRECPSAGNMPLPGEHRGCGGMNRVRMQEKREAGWTRRRLVRQKRLRFLVSCPPQFLCRTHFFGGEVKVAFICHLFIPLRILTSRPQTLTVLKLVKTKL